MEPVIIYRNGIVACSVCAKKDLSIKEITKQVNALNPTMSSSNWKLSKDKTFKGGEPNPCPCNEYPDNRVYYLFNC